MLDEESPGARIEGPTVRIHLAAPGPVDADRPGEAAALLRNAGGGPILLADVRLDEDGMGIELDFAVPRTDVARARRAIVESVRERTSMDARFARWVVDAVTPGR